MITDCIKKWTADVPWDRNDQESWNELICSLADSGRLGITKAVIYRQSTLEWLQLLPKSIKKLMLKFPPGCVVTSKKTLFCPAPNNFAIVSSYLNSTGDVLDKYLLVRGDMDRDTARLLCDSNQLEVVGYHRGLTSDVISALIAENDGNCQG